MLIRHTSPLAGIHSAERGVVMLEVLISMIILAIGLLGLAKLQASTRQLEMESYQRAQAMVLLDNIVNRMGTNKVSISCYVTTNLATGTPWVGQTDGQLPASCAIGTATQQQSANNDLAQWQNLLNGSAESNGGNSAGAMIGARGCIAYDAANNQYIVTVVWQGLMETAVPNTNCAQGLFGNDAQRRAVSATVRLATLT